MGLPLITVSGEAFAARMAGSLLHSLGLCELATHSLADYEALALRLARDPEALAAIRARLVQSLASSPLFDSDRFCRDLEVAYETMWQRWHRGEPPASFARRARVAKRLALGSMRRHSALATRARMMRLKWPSPVCELDSVQAISNFLGLGRASQEGEFSRLARR